MDTVTSSKAWDEALTRLLAFLTALEIGGLEHRLEVALRILHKARERHTETTEPVELTMGLLQEELEEWFAQALENPSLSAERRVALGIVALRLTDAGTHWPDALLLTNPPTELKEAFANVSLPTGPDLALSSMTPREMNFGTMENIAQETWHQFAWTPLLRAALLWTAIFFGVLFAYDHFFPV